MRKCREDRDQVGTDQQTLVKLDFVLEDEVRVEMYSRSLISENIENEKKTD